MIIWKTQGLFIFILVFKTMKTIATIAIAFMLIPVSFTAAAESQSARGANAATLHGIEQQIAHLRMLVLARVLGASTTNYFTVTSNGIIIAQSYVPVTTAVAQAWCADMAAMPSYQNTAIVCTHNGTVIYQS